MFLPACIRELHAFIRSKVVSNLFRKMLFKCYIADLVYATSTGRNLSWRYPVILNCHPYVISLLGSRQLEKHKDHRKENQKAYLNEPRPHDYVHRSIQNYYIVSTGSKCFVCKYNSCVYYNFRLYWHVLVLFVFVSNHCGMSEYTRKRFCVV